MTNYINIYNNLIKLTRNKLLYHNIRSEEVFSYRLTLFLIHFAFFLKVFKKENNKKLMQNIYDYNFKQIEISIREIGYGDVSINKKMKDYLNLFHKIIGDIDDWENIEDNKKGVFFINILDKNSNSSFFIEYFDNYLNNLKNKSLNYYINNIIDL
tara:strand:+ start:548 stop:1012 length:465 start_codon:yes stop_codon:yes gene_type:complete